MYYIYCITNEINKNTYIGQRKSEYLNDNYMGSGIKLPSAFKKYGIENFSKSILAITETKKNADILEKVFIAMYRAEGKAEYNIACGGQGGNLFENHKHNEEYKKYMRDINLGEKNPFYNKKHSDITKEKMRQKARGRKLSEETLKKISESLKGHKGYFKNHIHSEYEKQRISYSVKNKICKVKESYIKYKINHPDITWNKFQTLYKLGQI